MIVLVDYGAGNVTSVIKGLTAAGAEVRVAASSSEMEGASGIVVPGVGHFRATRALDADWRRAILDRVRAGVPLLGICLGLQWLFDGSDEDPGTNGLGVFAGRCFRLTGNVKVPHVGWNTVTRIGAGTALLDGVSDEAFAYFTHTFAAPVTAETTGLTDHGCRFASVVERGAVWGAQFHPEKSGTAGVRMLANFVARTRVA